MPQLRDLLDAENRMVVYPELDAPRIDCPVCGEDCYSVYIDMNGDAVGCDVCLRKKDVQEFWEDNPDWE